MAVYTSLTLGQVAQFFSCYDLGSVQHSVGIQAGVANTHYRVRSTAGDFILTLFEEMAADAVVPVLLLLNAVARQGLPVPRPVADRQGHYIGQLAGKPALLSECLPGASAIEPGVADCAAIGCELARLHVATQHYPFSVTNPYGMAGLRRVFAKVRQHLTVDEQMLAHDELAWQEESSGTLLPGGVIHADLFRDNVLLQHGKISGLLDFYSACQGEWLFDLAITANDWCWDGDKVNQEKMSALLMAYQEVRPLQSVESQLWPKFLRRTALRFWLSRWVYQARVRPGVLLEPKDPGDFKRKLLVYRQRLSF